MDPSLLHPSFHAFYHWLLSSLKSLGLVRSGLVEIDCIWAQTAVNLAHLDLSENPMSYPSLQNISHCSSLSFNYLTSLLLRHSNLTSLQSLCAPCVSHLCSPNLMSAGTISPSSAIHPASRQRRSGCSIFPTQGSRR